MTESKSIGIDLAKNIFHLVCCNQSGKIIQKKALKRKELLSYLANIQACQIGMESCATSHHWARQIKALGHEVKLIPAQYVKAFVRGNKNDFNDALAINEAMQRPEMRFVGIKSEAQQDLQSLHRLRSACVTERTAIINQIRGLLAEYGIAIKEGVVAFFKEVNVVLSDESQGHLTSTARILLKRRFDQVQKATEEIEFYSHQIQAQNDNNEICQRLQTIPGFGPIVSSAFFTRVGNGSAFQKGREVSASLGLVPKQHSSGGKESLLGISKRGDIYMRTLLIHAARSVARVASKKKDRLSLWVTKLIETRGYNKAVVALANKLARIGWAVTKGGFEYAY